jgi:hypothetical protein
MKTVTKIVLLLSTLAIGIVATGCPQQRSIAEINANPGRFQDKEVIIVGTVKDVYGLSVPGARLGGGIYKVDDGSGSIWVASDDGVPPKGSLVGVRGIFGSGVTWGNKTYGQGLYEKQRKYRRR